ncbi:hypothetical protein Syun_015994 [Stephania yunnanensis]|uniref:Uncharacterized protein n=1 Tax=Stephania yunnanensis TaxID=152371 RepID=A0AAP0J3Z8_9MAGN
MNQLKTTISKSTNLFRLNPNQALPILQTHHFCSATPATEQPPTSIVYGRLTGNGPYTMKTDIIHMLEGCDLSLQDVRVEYNRYYDPVAMHLKFILWNAYHENVRMVAVICLYRMLEQGRVYWNIPSYDGKTVLLQGLPRNALPEDVDRFLCGSECFTSTMQMFTRQGLSNPIKMALVQFPSQIEAMNSVISKNRSFCLNNQILMRVLQ